MEKSSSHLEEGQERRNLKVRLRNPPPNTLFNLTFVGTMYLVNFVFEIVLN